ncbi:hypothetical protein QAD02_008666 [Eretmocerus hayati]|uniref:Uncharacterized protein n=1 Tax=Eretmocerus hayati TaxID=131215 RepID=A0ACC2N7H5_9HYME|nr:hypothetical protein QAD02_008666 [Eretmocerus hayati]
MTVMANRGAKLSFSIERILSCDFISKKVGDKTLSWTTTRHDRSDACNICSSSSCLEFHHLQCQWTLTEDLIFHHVQSPQQNTSRVVKPAPIRPTAQGIMKVASCKLENNCRRRSWSRAVFSSLQRKGLEKRFAIQKYITKPDRRQLAATLGLTDAQVKVWFQNRRMKWRHTRENGVPLSTQPICPPKALTEFSRFDTVKGLEDDENFDKCDDDIEVT